MDFSTTKSERITAIVSTLIAVAILAGGVTAYQSHNKPVEDVVQLESDLRFQLEVGFRHDAQERASRARKLKAVTEAWQQSPQSINDREKLANWLLEATIRSMPGSIEALPTAPVFSKPEPPVVVAQQPTVIETPVVEEKLEVATTVNTTPAAPVPTKAEPVPEEVIAPIAEKQANELLVGEAEVLPEPAIELLKAPAPVQVNLSELNARIAGYHDGLNEIEIAARTLDTNDLNTLTATVRLLDGLARDYRFIRLYYESLSAAERRAIAEPRSVIGALSAVERRLDDSSAPSSGDFLEDFDTSHQDHLNELRQRLSEVVAQAE